MSVGKNNPSPSPKVETQAQTPTVDIYDDSVEAYMARRDAWLAPKAEQQQHT